jgi:hypothetical protein
VTRYALAGPLIQENLGSADDRTAG